MKRQWMLILGILLISFSFVVAQTNTGTTTGGTMGSNATNPQNSATAGSTTTTLNRNTGSNTTNINNVGTLNPGAFNTTTANTTTGTTLLGTGVGVNSLNGLNATTFNSLSTADRLRLLNAIRTGTNANGLTIDPVTGQVLNPLANPFNTGIVANPNLTIINGVAFTSDNSFPNGVGLNPNFPLNVGLNTSGLTTLVNPNANLTGGAGSAGFSGRITSATSASSAVGGVGRVGIRTNSTGVRFPALTLGSTAPMFAAGTLANVNVPHRVSGSTRTNVSGIVQRKDGTFTNVSSNR